MTFCAVIPAGGAGTRLWPLSRRAEPKFLQDLTGSGRSLLQQTADRLAPLADQILVVTGQAHQDAVTNQLPQLEPDQILVEPSPRESMAAIGIAAAVLLHRHPQEDVVIGSFAADHHITGTAQFARAVHTAVAAARQDYVAAIGIAPSEPSSAFGYIEMGERIDAVGGPAAGYRVRSFTEKPEAQRAAEYLAAGNYRWNAGMFIVRAQVLMDHLRRLQPTLAEGLHALAEIWDTSARAEHLDQIWPALTKIAIDYAIAEPVAATGGVVVVPADFEWQDLGDWQAVAGLLPTDDRQVGVLGPREHTTAIDSPGAVLVPRTGRQVVVLGVPDAVVVDTADALLVTTTSHAQGVKDIVTDLAEDNSDLL